MTFERVIEFGFRLAGKKPKILLPNILSWIPTTLFYVLIMNGLSKTTEWLGNDFSQILIDPKLMLGLLVNLLSHVMLAIPIVILGILIHLFLTCVYAETGKTAYSGRKIRLNKIFSSSIPKILPLFWTYFLTSLSLIGIILGLVLISGIGFVINPIFGIVFMMIFGILGIIISAFAVVIFWLIPAIVVIEKKKGIEAIKKTYRIGRKNIWSALAIIIILAISVSLINSVLSTIPSVGFLLFLLGKLFLDAWIMLAPASFYYEYVRRR